MRKQLTALVVVLFLSACGPGGGETEMTTTEGPLDFSGQRPIADRAPIGRTMSDLIGALEAAREAVGGDWLDTNTEDFAHDCAGGKEILYTSGRLMNADEATFDQTVAHVAENVNPLGFDLLNEKHSEGTKWTTFLNANDGGYVDVKLGKQAKKLTVSFYTACRPE